jgi:Ca2+-binding EF-hand superfamily protein
MHLSCLSLLLCAALAGAFPPGPPADPPAGRGPDAPAAGQRTTEQLFKEYDKNGDGVLTPDELPRDLRAHFAEYDLDKDGKWTLEDFRRAVVEWERRRAATEVARVLVQSAAHGEECRREAQRAYAALRALDADGNGTISRKELLRAGRRLAERRVDRLLMELDKDGDGRVSRAEARGELADEFDALDRDKDGYLSRDELLSAAVRPRAAGGGGAGGADKGPADAAELFKEYDKNGDGFLTPDELPGAVREALMRHDRDGDGRLSPKEFRRGLAALGRRAGPADWLFDLIEAAEREPHAQPDLQRAYRVLREADANNDGTLDATELAAANRRLIEREVDALIKELDADGDGRISKEEARKSGRALAFEEMDLDKDGFLTREELLRAMTGAGGGAKP